MLNVISIDEGGGRVAFSTPREARDVGSGVALVKDTGDNCRAAEPQNLGQYVPKWQNHDWV